MLIYCGYALAVIALMSVAQERGAKITPTNGMIWGVAGFVAAHLAPGFSLAPEVPGVAAADVTLRQMWFFPTVAAAALAMWLLAFYRNAVGIAVAVVLLLAPHVIGAPEPDTPLPALSRQRSRPCLPLAPLALAWQFGLSLGHCAPISGPPKPRTPKPWTVA